MVERCPRHKGRKELLKHLSGVLLSAKDAIKAKCYECSGYMADGIGDCMMRTCPLYRHNPHSSEYCMTPERKSRKVRRQ